VPESSKRVPEPMMYQPPAQRDSEEEELEKAKKLLQSGKHQHPTMAAEQAKMQAAHTRLSDSGESGRGNAYITRRGWRMARSLDHSRR